MLRPMLLTDRKEAFDDPAWCWQLKVDGIRGVVSKVGSTVRIFSRHQREITDSFPEVVADVFRAAPGDAWIDGELMVAAPDGRPDFYAVNGRHLISDSRKAVAAAKSSPATFMAFDIIERAGKQVGALPLSERLTILNGVVAPVGAVQLVDTLPGTVGRALFDQVAARDLEGIVGKRLNSRYTLDTRSRDWVKVKAWRTATVALVGVRFDPEFAVLVTDPCGSRLAAVELGWTPTDRGALVRILPELQERESDGIRWLGRVLCGRIRYRVTPDGRLREPVWAGFNVSHVAR